MRAWSSPTVCRCGIVSKSAPSSTSHVRTLVTTRSAMASTSWRRCSTARLRHACLRAATIDRTPGAVSTRSAQCGIRKRPRHELFVGCDQLLIAFEVEARFAAAALEAERADEPLLVALAVLTRQVGRSARLYENATVLHHTSALRAHALGRPNAQCTLLPHACTMFVDSPWSWVPSTCLRIFVETKRAPARSKAYCRNIGQTVNITTGSCS